MEHFKLKRKKEKSMKGEKVPIGTLLIVSIEAWFVSARVMRLLTVHPP